MPVTRVERRQVFDLPLAGALITHRRAADRGKEMAPAPIGLDLTLAYLAIAFTS